MSTNGKESVENGPPAVEESPESGPQASEATNGGAALERERWFRDRFEKEHQVTLAMMRLLVAGVRSEGPFMRFWRWLIDDIRSERRLLEQPDGDSWRDDVLLGRVRSWFARRGQASVGVVMAAAAVVASLLAFAGPAAAHGDAPAQRAIAIAPRAEMRIGNQEAVITYAAGTLVMFLHRYIDGVPTRGAELEVTVDFMPTSLAEIAPGVYRSEPLSLAGGRNDIELTYVIGEQEGSEVIPLMVSTSATAAPRAGPAPASGGVPGPLLAAVAVLLFAGVNLLLLRRARQA